MGRRVVPWLEHINLTTGHSRRSYADEVSEAALIACRDLLLRMNGDPAELLPITNTGYSLSGYTKTSRCLTVSIVREPAKPIVLMAVAGHSRCGAKVWRELHDYADEWRLPYVTDRNRPAPEPWCAALLDAAAATEPPDGLMMLGNLERYLAWAWLTLNPH